MIIFLIHIIQFRRTMYSLLNLDLFVFSCQIIVQRFVFVTCDNAYVCKCTFSMTKHFDKIQ
ncbi:MAG: hypothetical protein EBV45_05770 [Chloroflexi bacterium]|nr:hypothetical protein [Chloroflexota bacterium]